VQLLDLITKQRQEDSGEIRPRVTTSHGHGRNRAPGLVVPVGLKRSMLWFEEELPPRPLSVYPRLEKREVLFLLVRSPWLVCGEIPLILLTLTTVVRWSQGNVARACLNMPNFNVRDTKMLLAGLVEYVLLFFVGLGCDCATSINFLTQSRTGLRLLLSK
jgi:hypothetical protein